MHGVVIIFGYINNHYLCGKWRYVLSYLVSLNSSFEFQV